MGGERGNRPRKKEVSNSPRAQEKENTVHWASLATDFPHLLRMSSEGARFSGSSSLLHSAAPTFAEILLHQDLNRILYYEVLETKEQLSRIHTLWLGFI